MLRLMGIRNAMLPGKASSLVYRVPVPQTDTGIRDEYSKAREVTLSKELGKMAPYLRYKGYQLLLVTLKRPNRLFSKNIALC